MIEKIKKIIFRFAWIPIFTGIIGYYVIPGDNGLTVIEALYATIALYFVNPVTDINNTFILITKFLAVIVTATAVLDFLFSFAARVSLLFKSFFKDSAVVYCDNNDSVADKMIESFKHGWVIKGDDLPEKHLDNVKRYVVMYNDDLDCLSFLSNHSDELKDKDVYMFLDEIDSSLIKAIDHNYLKLHILNRYELLARDYWKKYNLFDKFYSDKNIEKKADEPVKIAIIGYGSVGQMIFRHGFVNNLYTVGQTVEYHIWGCSSYDAGLLKSIDTMNNDSIIVHSCDIYENISEIRGMDRIIVANTEDCIRLIQEILYTDNCARIHCYLQKKTDLGAMLGSEKRVEEKVYSSAITVFGDMEDILTEENIIGDSLYRMGKLIHYDYELYQRVQKGNPAEFDESEMNRLWDSADGYSKASSLARADHYWIEKRIREEGYDISEDDCSKLEHIRWCRFLFMNHYVYSENKVPVTRTHHYLRPYEELREEVKYCDRINVEVIRERLDECVPDKFE